MRELSRPPGNPDRLDLRSLGRPLVIAHRGYCARYPENTLAAFEGAVEAGCHMIELDVNLTRDRRLAVIHDHVLDRTTSGSGPVRDATLGELRRLDAGSWFHPRFAGERVPELGEVLERISGRVPLNIEIKRRAFEAHDPPDAVERQVVDLVRRHQATSWVVISSFEVRILERVAAMENPPALSILSEEPAGAELIRLLADLKAVSWNPSLRVLSRDQVARVHAAGCLVLPWTVVTRKDWDRVMEMGADGAFCNEIQVGRSGT
jgi:glycerophosphoryl diester phosphodiesterase